MDEPILITQTVDGSLRVALRGPLVFGTVERIGDKLRDAVVRLRPTALVVDLSEVTFLDSSGVSVLVAVRRMITRTGGACLVERATPPVLAQLALAGLTQLFGLRAAQRRAQAPPRGPAGSG
jgi:anti-anti-sigma factor